MVKLDGQVMRHMCKDDFRVLTAIEMGMRNHHSVPVSLIGSIAGIRGSTARFLSTLLRFKLVYHDNTKYDGYRLTWTGYDVLALNVFCQRQCVDRLGGKIGEGKESDVYEGFRDSDGTRVVIKFHRLGKTSFKAVKAKRDYLRGRSAGNWLNVSRLAAKKEWEFLNAIQGVVRTPEPIDHNRHAVVMTLAPGLPLYQIGKLADDEATGRVFEQCLESAHSLARKGLIHCDFNEFNLIVDGDVVTVIDFPQMISTSHPNAQDYFTRDINGILKFFRSKLRYDDDDSVRYDDLDAVLEGMDHDRRLDIDLQASGFDHQ